MSNQIRVLPMETALAEDASGEYRQSLQSALEEDLVEVKTAMNAGLSPDEFQTARRLADAIRRAQSVVDKVWRAEQRIN